MKKLFSLSTLVAFAAMFFTACGDRSEINKKISDWTTKLVKQDCWETSYDYSFEGTNLVCVEVMSLFPPKAKGKDQSMKFEEICNYFYNNELLAKVTCTGTWFIEYDNKLDAYFFIEDYDDAIKIENINMAPQFFKKFDTEIRYNLLGDAYDSLNDPEDGTIYHNGYQIIDCTNDIFIIEDLEEEEIYRYEAYQNPEKDVQIDISAIHEKVDRSTNDEIFPSQYNEYTCDGFYKCCFNGEDSPFYIAINPEIGEGVYKTSDGYFIPFVIEWENSTRTKFKCNSDDSGLRFEMTVDFGNSISGSIEGESKFYFTGEYMTLN